MKTTPGNAPKGLFITDLDGTLLGSDGGAAQRDIDALELLSRHGVRTAIATGRSLYSFLNSPGAALPVDYTIFSTGAGVITQTGKQLLHGINMSAEAVAVTLAFMQDLAVDFMLHSPVPDNHRYVYRRVNSDNLDFETRIRRYRKFGIPLGPDHLNYFGEASQFLIVVPRERAEEALTEVRTGLPGMSVVRTTSPLDHESTWIEVFHPNVSKGKTAAWLASHIGVKHAETMAVGNDYNDLDLLEWAAQSFAVDNAPENIKCRFQQVASNNHGGVAEAVSRWFDDT